MYYLTFLQSDPQKLENILWTLPNESEFLGEELTISGCEELTISEQIPG